MQSRMQSKMQAKMQSNKNDKADITIVGLGPGDPAHWTLEAHRVLSGCREVYLRTAKHPGVEAMPEGVKAHSFDRLYDKIESFTELYERIARQVVALGKRRGGVVYAVPGHPMVGEATVPQIRRMAAQEGLSVRIVPGLSFVEPVLTALGIDAMDGLQIVDAMEIAGLHHPPLNPDRPTLAAQLYGRRLASGVKLTLMNAYPEDFAVTLVYAAGTAAEKTVDLPLHELDRVNDVDHLTTLYIPPWPSTASLESFQDTIARLRAPDGCPWDREQTHQSLRHNLLEEAYEVLDALDADDPDGLAEELGDLLLQIALHAQIAAEGGDFRMGDVVGHIDAKIKHRHPHVFGSLHVDGVDDVMTNWESLKKEERAANGVPEEQDSILKGVPSAMPALAQALAISRRAARVGFEWDNIESVFEKLDEEVGELREAGTKEEWEWETGDVLFVVVNLARWLGVDPESALRATNNRFRRRFKAMEQMARREGRDFADLDIREMDSLWEEAKGEEAKGRDGEEELWIGYEQE